MIENGEDLSELYSIGLGKYVEEYIAAKANEEENKQDKAEEDKA